jgi:iron complex outermembrane receptor protein
MLTDASIAFAQKTQQDPEEVVVTARRRSETLQSVPVAVSVVSGALALKENRNNVPDLIAVIPSVEFRSQPSNKDQDILIRGLGTITTSAGAEPTVSTVIDGVVLARPGQMVSDMLDIDHIEVLRGPQGTLFGKNASAGVLNIVTKNPTPDLGGFFDASYYQGNEYRFAGAVNGELIKNQLSARITGLVSSYDGNVKNIFNGAELNGYDRKGFRAKFLYTPTNDLSILVGGDYMYTKQTVSSVYIANYNINYPAGIQTFSTNLLKALTAAGITPSQSNLSASINSPSADVDLTAGTFVQADYNFSGYTLTSITAYRYWRNVQSGDLDSFPGLTTLTPTQQVDLGHVFEHQYSEELRLASPKGGFIDYQIGGYFLHAPDKETYRRDTTQLLASGSTVANFGFNSFGATSTNYSVFGESNINFTKDFRAIAGLRLVHDDLRFYTNRITSSATAVPGINPAFNGAGSTKVDDYAARAGLQYDISPSINTYVTYSRGYKGPAFNVFFNMTALQTNALSPETSDAYEIGLKSKLFDNKLQFNVALFDDKVANYQANQPDLVAGTVVTRLINAGTVSTRGIEIDAVGKFVKDLTLTAAVSYLDAKIDNFNCPPGAAVSCQVNGKPLPFAPKTKFHVRADYLAFASGPYEVNVATDYSYQTKQQDSISQTPDTIQPAYGIWNASISLTNTKGDWDTRVVVRNIADKHYYGIIGEGNGGLVAIPPRDFSRYVGVSFHKNF